MNAIRGQKNAKRGFDRSVDRPVEWRFAFCLQQNRRRGVGGGKRLLDDQHFLADFRVVGYPDSVGSDGSIIEVEINIMRRNLTLVLALAAGLLGGFLSRYIAPTSVHAQMQPPDALEIRAQRFSIVDAQGHLIGTFTPTKKSSADSDRIYPARISLVDAAGRELWSAGGDMFKSLSEGSK